VIVVSGRAIRMTSDAFCTRVWKRASLRRACNARSSSRGRWPLLPARENLDRASELEGELGSTCDNYQPLQLVLGDKGAHELFRHSCSAKPACKVLVSMT